MGLGAPFLLASLATSACVGLLLYMVMPRTGPATGDPAAEARIADLERQAASLRHDLRGALSPALIVADRLTGSADPAVRKAGESVARSVERASSLIAAAKAEETGGVPKSKA